MKFSSMLALSAIAATALFSTACQNVQDPDPENANLNRIGANDSIGGFGSNSTGYGSDGVGGASDFTKGGLTREGDPAGWVRIEGANLPSIYFATDANTLGQSEATKLTQVSEWLSRNPGVGFIIEGNCDERGTEEYNRALGERRALAVKEYLMERGVQDAHMHTLSYGEDKPKATGSDEASFQENRRADIIPAKMK